MVSLTRIVLAALLTAWFAPKVVWAAETPTPRAPVASQSTTGATSAPRAAGAGALAQYGEREQASGNLADFRGGGTTIYVGSGLLLVIVIVLLILLL